MAYFGVDSTIRIEELHYQFKIMIRRNLKGGPSSL